MRSFIDGIRTRQETICPAEVGHRFVSVCHLGNLSMRRGNKGLNRDPKMEVFNGEFQGSERNARLPLPRPLEAVTFLRYRHL